MTYKNTISAPGILPPNCKRHITGFHHFNRWSFLLVNIIKFKILYWNSLRLVSNVISKAREYNFFQSVAGSGYIFKILAFAVAAVCFNERNALYTNLTVIFARSITLTAIINSKPAWSMGEGAQCGFILITDRHSFGIASKTPVREKHSPLRYEPHRHYPRAFCTLPGFARIEIPRWRPVELNDRHLRSHGKIGDCEQSRKRSNKEKKWNSEFCLRKTLSLETRSPTLRIPRL